MTKEVIAYNRAELRSIKGAFKAMDEESLSEAKRISSTIADTLAKKIFGSASYRERSAGAVMRVAEGYKVSKSSKIGELSYGFAGQKFSGGATTQMLWGGLEFGSKKWRQFPSRNKLGYFIYPTLRAEQSNLVAQWEDGFSKIVGKWD